MATTLANASISTTAQVQTSSMNMSSGEIFTLTVMLVVSTLSLLGNLLVIGAVCMRKSLRTQNNILILNLAVADLGQGTVAIALRITEVFNRGTEPLVPCLFVLFVTILFFGSSMITVALISIDRFVAIRWPFFYTECTTHTSTLIAISCCWLFMIIFSAVPYMDASRRITPATKTKFCFFPQHLSKAYLITMVSIINILIIVILLVTNTYLLKETIRHIARIKTQVVPMPRDENTLSTTGNAVDHASSQMAQVGLTRARNQRLIKATRVTLVVVGFTIVLTTPIMVIDLISIWNPNSSPSIVTRISIAMAYANSCVNPWIFAGISTLYRQTYIDVLKKLKNMFLCKNQ